MVTAAKKKPVAKKATPKKPAKNSRNAGHQKLAQDKRRAIYLKTLASGCTKTKAAKAAGLSFNSVYRYIKVHPEFADEILAAELSCVGKVEDALFMRAVGYEYEENKYITVDGKLKRQEKTVKQIAPDVVACIFYLKNRAPERWKDKHDVEYAGNVIVILPEGMDDA